VIPNEYGIDAAGKMRIGSKICCALLGKLLADLANMREESIATAVRDQGQPAKPLSCFQGTAALIHTFLSSSHARSKYNEVLRQGAHSSSWNE
jgi:hypothetical protein